MIIRHKLQNVEQAIINRLLSDRNTELILKHRLKADDFTLHKKEFEYIDSYRTRFGQIPTLTAFEDKFEEFEVGLVEDPLAALVERLHEQRLYGSIRKSLTHAADLVTNENAFQALSYLEKEIEKLRLYKATGGNLVDIAAEVESRKQDYLYRAQAKGVLGIPSGFPSLDEITNGWLPGEFIVIGGRLNEGKSWVLLKFLAEAWLAKQKVALVSLEMTPMQLGYRLDTLIGKYDNHKLQRGRLDNPDSYFDFLEKLGSGFLVATPTMDHPQYTPSDVERLIRDEKPNIVGIDGLLLMSGDKSEQNRRLELVSITRSLKQIALRTNVPILLIAQANRNAVKDKKEDETPGIEDLAETDSSAQDADKVLTLRKIGPLNLKMTLKKNRTDATDRDFMLYFDVNLGDVRMKEAYDDY